MNLAKAETLACPGCGKGRDALVISDDGSGRCRYCSRELEVIPFPALDTARRSYRPKAVAVDASTCFFHATNQADDVCSDCGRFLCTVCSLPNGAAVVCPRCISQRSQTDVTLIPSRIIYSGAVLRLAFLPLLMWPLTIVTAPAAVSLAVIGWKRPKSIVGGGRAGLVIGGGFALIQCVMWGWFFLSLIRSGLE